MRLGDLPLHLLALAHGISVAVACFAVLSLCGLALDPRARDRIRTPGPDGFPVILGAAVYALFCWFGIQRGIPLLWLMPAYAAFVVIAVAVRFRRVKAELTGGAWLSRTAAGWLLAFAALYTLAYVFFTPPVSDEYLPLSPYLNLDVHAYIAQTTHLLRLGSSNVAGESFLGRVYLIIPAVYDIFALFSVGFSGDPLWAAMPMQFSLIGLVGLLAARLSSSVFSLRKVASVAVGCALVSGPFFRYVAASYYLSTLMSVPVVIHLIWVTASHRSAERFSVPRVIEYAAHYVLLLLLYPIFCFSGPILQAAVVGLRELAHIQSSPSRREAWREAVGQGWRVALAVAAGAGVVVALMPGHVRWSLEAVTSLSQPGVAGWPLEFISPLALLGVPGQFDQVPMTDASLRLLGIGGLLVGAVALVGLCFWRFRSVTSALERTFVGLFAGSLVAYVLYYLKLGPSYQQWKFASYFPLPLSFVLWPACTRLLRGSMPADDSRRTVWSHWVAVAAAVVCVGGNVWIHVSREPDPPRLDARLRHLSTIDQLSGFRELDAWLDNPASTMLAAHFIRTKQLHLASESYFPSAPVALDRVSSSRPYFIQGYSCDGVGHGDTLTVAGLGCLLYAPPSPMVDVPYPFSHNYLFMEPGGLSLREPWGRWNGRRVVTLTFTVDVLRVRADGDLFLNLQVVPHQLPHLAARHVDVVWGANRQSTVNLAGRQWISLPVGRRDWTGGPRLRTLTVTLTMPDAIPPREVDNRFAELRPIAVGFEMWSLTASPHGTGPTAADRQP